MYQSILLASCSIASVRLQEATVNKLQVSFKRARRLSLALRSDREYKDCRKEENNDTQSDRKLVKRVTGDES
jgi:hypothetical protein